MAEINFFDNARSCLTITSQSTRKAYGHFSFGEHIRLSKPDRTLGRNSELVIGETIGDPPENKKKPVTIVATDFFMVDLKRFELPTGDFIWNF